MEDWLKAQRRAKPDGLALVYEGKEWNYAALNSEVDRLCGQLTTLGVREGEAMAVHLSNSPLFVFLIHAAARLGLVLVPVNTRLALLEVSSQLEHMSCDWLVSAEARAFRRFVKQKAVTPEKLEKMEVSPFQAAPMNLERLQAIVFTSGTGGKAKGAMLTFANHFWSAWASAGRMGVYPQERWLSVLPLYHVGGQAVVFRSCLYGTTISLQGGFDLDQMKRSFDEEPVTLVSLVPTMLQRLLSANVEFPAKLRLVLLGGAAAPDDLIKQCEAKGLEVATSYGLTEAASQVATGLPGERHKLQSDGLTGHWVGKPLLFTQVRIVNDTGEELAPGDVGEIVVKGPTVMRGYYRDEAATQAILRDGELHTGDLGYLDQAGNLWVMQRRSDLILSGGENVYPAEVEAAIRQHPAVAEVCVVGVLDEVWGQRVTAAVVLKPGESLQADELVSFARDRLAGYKLPKQVEFWDSLPLTASGKVERRKVAEKLSKNQH